MAKRYGALGGRKNVSHPRKTKKRRAIKQRMLAGRAAKKSR